MFSFTWFVGLLALSSVAVQAGRIDNNSFKPPFKDFDIEGNRMIKNWAFGGNAVANQNFVRLTPDRANKRGWLWNKHPLEAEQWTANLRFRISGQGKRLFGDGFVLWVTQHSFFQDGPIHGFADRFIGFGLIFDTFRNTEAGHVHKDISLVINNDEQISHIENVDHPGCDADFRYHEGRDDFSVDSRSTVKITFKDNKLSVHIDARNSGHFVPCIQDAEINLPTGWHRSAYLGLTATTGQLADNHDILSLQVTDEIDSVLPEEDPAPPLITSTGSHEVDAAIQAAIDRSQHEVEKKVSDLHHHLEHQLSSVHDSLKHTLKKLQDQEGDNVQRIEALEERLGAKVSDEVSSGLSARLKRIEEAMNLKVNQVIDDKVHPNIQTRIDEALSSTGRSWIIPFFVLLAIIAGVGFFAYRKIKDMTQKSHVV